MIVFQENQRKVIMLDIDCKRVLFKKPYLIIVSSFIKQPTVTVGKLAALLENSQKFVYEWLCEWISEIIQMNFCH